MKKLAGTNWNTELLDSQSIQQHDPNTLKACFHAHGLYNNIQFVLRLSPKVHNKIAQMPEGIVKLDFDSEYLQAHSTYIHETIHWWQYSGSTAGMMLSLSYPSQTQANYSLLKKFVDKVGPKKSVLKFVENDAPAGGDPHTVEGLSNNIVNNHFDTEFFKLLISRPKELTQKITEHKLFESVGHSYYMTYYNVISLLAITHDTSYQVLPNPEDWAAEYSKFRHSRVKGYYWGSDINVSPIGAVSIFEGQARFSQLLYLYFAFRGQFTWQDAEQSGMLTHTYMGAFELFLSLTELERPPEIDHPIVGLFLLVCDIAINPSAGFPMQITDFKGFITDVDPGHRFLFLCMSVKAQPEVAQKIVEYTKSEYIEVSEQLTKAIRFDSPLEIAERVSKWPESSQAIRSLMNEFNKFRYTDGNLTLKLLLSHFIALNKNKTTNPEFFCWPGAWMTGDRITDEIANIFEEQSAPFVDRPDDEGVYPRKMKGKDEADIQDSFDKFYIENVCYDLSRQWISSEGPFVYDYSWLTSNHSKEEIKKYADYHFKGIYGIAPDDFEIL